MTTETISPEGQAGRAKSSFWSLGGPKPIGIFLFLLIIVTIIPAIAISTVLLHRNDMAQREVVNTLAEAMAGSIAEAVDRELSGMMTTLRVLSTSPALAEEDYGDFYERARSALAGTGTYLILLDEDLGQILNTRVPFGTELGKTSHPQSALEALQTRTGTISGVFFGQTSGKWVFNVILPYIPEGDEGEKVLIMTRNAESLTDSLSQQMLRGGWNASLVDAQGTVLASSFMASNTGQPFFLELPKSTGSPMTVYPRSEAERTPHVAIVDESNYSGWRVVVWAPTASIEEPVRRSLRMLFIANFLTIAIGFGAAWLLGRQIAGPVRRLARDARRLGAGESVEAVAYPIAEVATVSTALAEAARDRKKAENDIRLLMREVAHRSKNQLTVVSSMAKQTARSARTLKGFQDAFQKRLFGLARSTDLLIAGGAAGVELRELLLAQIEPFRPENEKQLSVSGPAFRLSNQAAQTIGLAAHELSTNASKYGAFASPEGKLSLTWTIDDEYLTINWKEQGLTLRRRPTRRGFGTEIIERMVGGTLDAEITRNFRRTGLECIFKIPLERVRAERTAGVGPF